MPTNKKEDIEEWIQDGNEGFCSQGLETVDDLLTAAGRLLDSACSYDIVGPVLFKTAAGKYYTGNVQFVIEEADADYVEEVKAEIEDEND